MFNVFPQNHPQVKDFAVSNATAAPPALVQPTLATSPLHQPSFTLSTLPTTASVLPQQPPTVTPKTNCIRSGFPADQVWQVGYPSPHPITWCWGTSPPGVTSLTPTIAQLKAAQAAMAKSASAGSAPSGSNVSKLQTVKQLTSGHSSKKTATLAGQLSSSSTAAASVGSPILTVTSLGLSMTSSSSSAIFSSPSLSVSSSLAAQLLYSQGITIGSASPLTTVFISPTSESPSNSTCWKWKAKV